MFLYRYMGLRRATLSYKHISPSLAHINTTKLERPPKGSDDPESSSSETESSEQESTSSDSESDSNGGEVRPIPIIIPGVN